MFLGEVCIETNDVIKLAEFYRKILKIHSDNDTDDKDEIHQSIISEGVGLTVYNDGHKKNNQNENISLAFTVDDVEEEYYILQKMGVNIIQTPKVQTWGAKNMIFKDPDGNKIYFRSIQKDIK